MINKLKIKYNKWLFNKYGIPEMNIPILLKLNPLYSPSLYYENFGKCFSVGIKESLKKEKI